MLIDMFEKAYLMYHEKNECIHLQQWNGWVGTIQSYCYRENFQREWQNIGEQFDMDFYRFMQELISDKKTM